MVKTALVRMEMVTQTDMKILVNEILHVEQGRDDQRFYQGNSKHYDEDFDLNNGKERKENLFLL
jgi:hypothetical protein